MKAWRFYGFGDMRLDDVPEPLCKPGHVVAEPLCVQPSVTEAQLARDIPTLAYERIKRRLEKDGPQQLFGHEFCARIVAVVPGRSNASGKAVGLRAGRFLRKRWAWRTSRGSMRFKSGSSAKYQAHSAGCPSKAATVRRAAAASKCGPADVPGDAMTFISKYLAESRKYFSAGPVTTLNPAAWTTASSFEDAAE